MCSVRGWGGECEVSKLHTVAVVAVDKSSAHNLDCFDLGERQVAFIDSVVVIVVGLAPAKGQKREAFVSNECFDGISGGARAAFVSEPVTVQSIVGLREVVRSVLRSGQDKTLISPRHECNISV